MMKESFYQVTTPERALEIYLKNEEELYAKIKNNIIKEILHNIYSFYSWEDLKILEIGAGGGIWTKFFLKKGAKVVSVDVCEQILKGNRKINPQAKFIIADAMDIKLNEKFDLIFVKDVIEHIRDDIKFLKNMNHHLKRKGYIVIVTQNSFSFNYLLQGGYHILKGNIDWCGWDPTHLRFYNYKKLKRILIQSEFIPIKWFGHYFFPYRLLNEKMCRNKLGTAGFHLVESLKLYDKFPFRILGWGIGVIGVKNAK